MPAPQISRCACALTLSLLAACGGDTGSTQASTATTTTSVAAAATNALSGTTTTSTSSTGSTGSSTTSSPSTTTSLTINETVIASATENAGFSTQLTASGGTGSHTWSVKSGVLPTGLALSTAGVLSGTPSSAGIYAFTVGVADAASPQHTAYRAYNLSVLASGTVAQVTLAAAASSTAVASNFAGFSYEKHELSLSLFETEDTTMIALFKRLGPGLLRIGGASVDHTLWSATGAGKVNNQVSPSDVDRLAGFLTASNWQVLYGIEFLNEATSPVSKADPALVAAEAVYAMESLGDRLYGFELGNEPDLYNRKISGYTYANFQADWETYHSAILAAVAAAKAAGKLPQSATPRFSGPAVAFSPSYVSSFAAAESDNISLITRHYYVADGTSASSTMSLLLTPDPTLPNDLSAMQADASNNRISAGYRITEANSFYYGGTQGVSNAFGSALWSINFLFQNAWAGSSGVNFHGGWSVPYSPIYDNQNAAISVQPEYYGMYLFSQAAAGGNLIETTSSLASSSLYAYAVAGTSNTRVVLVNTSATTAYTVDVQFNRAVTTASYTTLTGPSLTATSGTLLNGSAIQTNGSWPETAPPALAVTSGSLQVPVPAYSAILLTAQ